MESKEVLGIQAARRAIADVRALIDDPLARDRLERTESVLSRVAASLGRRSDFDAALPPQPSDHAGAVNWAHRSIQEWEAKVAAFDPRRTAEESTDENLAGRLQAYLLSRYPDDADLKVISARRLPGGRSKHTVIVELSGSSHLPSRIVLRTDSTRTTVYDQVAREFPAIDAVFKAGGCPTPQPFFLENDPGITGAPFIAFSHMKGEPAGNLWGAHDKSGDAARELAVALADLHKLPITIVPGGQPQSARQATADLFAQYEQRWRAGRPDESFVIGSAFKWLRERLDCLDGDAVIVHGDAHFSNMLMHDGKLVCMLDWEFWHFGHWAEDLAYCRPYIEQTGDWGDFLDRYVAAGGRRPSTESLDMFAVWRPLRNAVLASNVAYDFRAKEDLDLETAAIAWSTYPRMEAQVAIALNAAVAGAE